MTLPHRDPRPRRDPRAERAARLVAATPRPRFDLAAPTAADPVGPSGRPRRDPRAERDRVAVAGTARPRLDRGRTAPAEAPASAAPVATAAPAPRVRVIEAPAFLVLAVVEAANGRTSSHEAQAIGAARRLADASGGGAVVLVAAGPLDDAGALGADRTVTLAPLPADAEAVRLADLVERLAPRHVVLPHDARGADLARRLAAGLGEAPFLDAEQVTASLVVRTARAGAVDLRAAPPRILTVAADRVAAHAGLPHEARPLALDLAAAPASRFVAVEEIAADPATVPLGEAGFVVSAGAGVDDFATFHALVEALGATPGASRVVCDAGRMPRAAQVGASGTVLTADCYFALGISGAPQHLQGIGACPNVIAVDTDLHAAMIERAGLAVVADAQAVMPAILAALAARAGEDEEPRA